MTAPESATPETDKAKFRILSSLQSGTDEVVHAWVSESLEISRNEHRAEAERLRQDLAAARACIRDLMSAKSCEFCPNQGWYAERDPRTGDPVQVQCEFCECEPTSLFNVKQKHAILSAEEAR